MKKSSLVSKKAKIALICSLIICSMFFISYIMTMPIEKDVCTNVTTELEYYKTVRGKYIAEKGFHLHCSNSEAYYIADSHLGYGLKERIEELDKGTRLTLIINEYDNEIVELVAENQVIFSYSDYAKQTKENQRRILYLFLFTLILPVIAIINISKEKNRFNKKAPGL